MSESTEQFGKYRLLDRIAIGGMAEIFKAKTIGVGGFERLVAIKRLHRHLSDDEELAQTLADEARIAVQLTHASIGQVFDLGCINGQYFMVMEYIDGLDFHGILRRMREQDRTIPIPITLYAVEQMLGALDYAHNRLGEDGLPLNIVHRDVSPQNLMLNLRGEVKLVDFGIARAQSRVMHTQAGVIKGKFFYMAPEQAYGSKLDARTDIFSAGMVLYELLTNRPAYDEAGDLALLKKVRAVDFAPPSSWRRDLDPQLEALIMRALHREPAQRYSSAREFQFALSQYIQQRFGQVSPYDAAEFIKGVMEPETQQELSAQALLQRSEYRAEDSVIFDATGLALTDPGRRTGAAESHTELLSNPFTENEATYVYSREEAQAQLQVPEQTAPARALPPRPGPAPRPSEEATDQHDIQLLAGLPARPRAQRAAPVTSAPVTGAMVSVRGAIALPPRPQGAPAASVSARPHGGGGGLGIAAPDVSLETQPHDLSHFASAPPSAFGAPQPSLTQPSAPGMMTGAPAATQAPFAAAPDTRSGLHDARRFDPKLIVSRLRSFNPRAVAPRVWIVIAAALAVALLLGVALSIGEGEGDDAEASAPMVLAPPPGQGVAIATVSLPITSNPSGADVSVNGELIGKTPLTLPDLEAGTTLEIAAMLPDYPTWTRSVFITRYPKPLLADLDALRPRPGVLKVVTTPPGIKIEVNDEDRGKSPLELPVRREGAYKVVAVREDGTMRRQTLTWSDRERATMVAEFSFDDASTDSGLPEPPQDTTRRNVRRTSPSRPPPRPKVNVWGDKPSVASPEPVAKVNVWGGGDAADKPVPQPDADAKPGFLMVYVKGDQSGKVYLDGKDTGKSAPLRNYKLSSGDHRVTVRYSKNNQMSDERVITVKPGQTSRVTFDPAPD